MLSINNIPAPAKVNVFIKTLSCRIDKYHNLKTLYQLINLEDKLNFELRFDGKINIKTNKLEIIKENNLILNTAIMLKKITNSNYGVNILLNKKIPIGSGLGGGSSNAASTLIVLNRLWKCGLSRDNLIDIGLSIGSDIPFFILGKNSFAENSGEKLTELNLKVTKYLLIKPKCNFFTRNIFKNLYIEKKYLNKEESKFFILSKIKYRKNIFVNIKSLFKYNDLESKKLYHYKKLKKIIYSIKKLINDLKYEHGNNYCSKLKISGSGSFLYINCKKHRNIIFIKKKIENLINFSSIKKQIFLEIKFYDTLHEHPLKNWIK